MILFVFEGKITEPKVMATLQHLYFPSAVDQLLCYYGTDTYTLWKDIKEHEANGYDADIFSIVKQRIQRTGDHSLDKYNSYQIESIYLFFDYDPQNRTIPPERLNQAIEEMALKFIDPMETGKIFISYPMLEGLFCLSSIPDPSFNHVCVPLSDCHGFKGWCQCFPFARKPEMLLLDTDKLGNIKDVPSDERKQDLLEKWNDLVKMTAKKANFICSGIAVCPKDVDAIPQIKIFQHERDDYVIQKSSVSIISAFPLFLFDYFHGNGVL